MVQFAQPCGQPFSGQMTAQLGWSHSNEHPEVSRLEHRVSHLGASQTGSQTSSHSGLVHDHLQTGVHPDLFCVTVASCVVIRLVVTRFSGELAFITGVGTVAVAILKVPVTVPVAAWFALSAGTVTIAS